MSFTIPVNKNLTLTFSKQLTEKQKLIVKKLDTTDAIEYLNSMVKTIEPTKYRHNRSLWQVREARNDIAADGLDTLANKQPLSVLNKFLSQFDAGTNKRPDDTDLGDWIGVEIECYMPKNLLRHETNCTCDCTCGIDTTCESCDYGCDCEETAVYESEDTARKRLREAFKNARIKNVTVKDDGSIRCEDRFFSVEICVLFRKKDTQTLEKTCALLEEWEAQVNKSCGLHVHLDARDCTPRQATARGKRLGNALPVFATMVPKSRRSNSYCKLEVGKQRGSRYYAVNMVSYQKFKTIEVRLHSGTTDFTKISNWVSILYKVSRASKMTNNRATCASTLFVYAGLSVQERDYVSKRIDQFSIDANEENNSNIAA